MKMTEGLRQLMNKMDDEMTLGKWRDVVIEISKQFMILSLLMLDNNILLEGNEEAKHNAIRDYAQNFKPLEAPYDITRRRASLVLCEHRDNFEYILMEHFIG